MGWGKGGPAPVGGWKRSRNALMIGVVAAIICRIGRATKEARRGIGREGP